MICRTCRDPIPDGQLDCRRCLSAKSYQALVALQRHWIARMANGDVMMRFSKPAEEPKWHMSLGNHPQAWCGRELKAQWKSKRRATWTATNPETVCDFCRQVFEQLAKDAAAEVA